MYLIFFLISDISSARAETQPQDDDDNLLYVSSTSCLRKQTQHENISADVKTTSKRKTNLKKSREKETNEKPCHRLNENEKSA